MRWILQQDPATSLDDCQIEQEFMRLRDEGGGESRLTDTMILEVVPEQGLNVAYIYSMSKTICGIVKAD